jgi:uncharacterized phage protein gp47/JayE
MTVTPNLDYTSRDYDGLRTSLLQYAQYNFPAWQPSSEGDFGVLIVELLAYLGDIMSYYVDRAQNEAYLTTATQRASVLNIAKLLGYKPGTGTPATGRVNLQSAKGSPAITVPAGTQLATSYVDAVDGPIIFETDADVVVPAGVVGSDGSYTGGVVGVNVTEGQTIKDSTTGGPLHVASATGYPSQTYRLPNPNIYSDTIAIYVDGILWNQIDHLLEAQAGDRVYTVDQDANGYSWITFGDGVNGVVPALGLDIGAIYRTGYGSRGNLAKGAINSVYTPIPGLSLLMLDATTGWYDDPTTGGADPESTEQIRTNAPVAFNTQQRAVTVDDFAAFALSVPGVAKAASVADYWSSVTTYVIGPDGNSPSSALLDRVAKTLQSKALAGVTANVDAPSFVRINVGTSQTDYAHAFSYSGSVASPMVVDPKAPTSSEQATVAAKYPSSPVSVDVWPTYSRTTVQFNVEQAIQNYLSLANQNMGSKITVAALYSVIMAVEGVRYVAIPLLTRDDQTQSGTADIQLKTQEFPVANMIAVQTTGGLEG